MEGQVRGVARMIEREEYCIDILQQTAALRAAVDAVSLLLMEDHVAGCLATAVKTGEAQAYTEEVMEVVRRSMGRPVRVRADATEPVTARRINPTPLVSSTPACRVRSLSPQSGAPWAQVVEKPLTSAPALERHCAPCTTGAPKRGWRPRPSTVTSPAPAIREI